MRLARSLLLLVVVAACGGPSRPPPPPARAATPIEPAPPMVVTPTPPPRPLAPVDQRLVDDVASFDFMWQKVADTFWDPKYDGVDWQAVRTEFRPLVAASKSRDEARKAMSDALQRLGKTHFGVSSSDAATPGAPSGDADPGVDLRIIDGEAVVLRVELDSPAAKAKLVPGMVIDAIDHVKVAPILAAVAEDYSSLTPLRQVRATMNLLRGPVGSKVVLDLKGGGTPTVERAMIGRTVSLGNLGNEPLIYEARWLDKQIAYIRLSIFLDPGTVMPQLASDLARFAKAKGVILDLRGNPGGIGGMAMGIAGYLVAEHNEMLGTMHMRTTKLDFVINPQTIQFPGKVAVLIDELSASTSEILAGGLQDLHRARVFGRTSPGAALPSVIDLLPNGDRFQYAIADYVSTGGKVLEGHGVTPDVVVHLDVKSLRALHDPDVAAATKWITSKDKP